MSEKDAITAESRRFFEMGSKLLDAVTALSASGDPKIRELGARRLAELNKQIQLAIEEIDHLPEAEQLPRILSYFEGATAQFAQILQEIQAAMPKP